MTGGWGPDDSSRRAIPTFNGLQMTLEIMLPSEGMLAVRANKWLGSRFVMGLHVSLHVVLARRFW